MSWVSCLEEQGSVDLTRSPFSLADTHQHVNISAISLLFKPLSQFFLVELEKVLGMKVDVEIVDDETSIFGSFVVFGESVF